MEDSMKIKRVLAILLAISLSFSLIFTSCDKDDDDDDGKKTTQGSGSSGGSSGGGGGQNTPTPPIDWTPSAEEKALPADTIRIYFPSKDVKGVHAWGGCKDTCTWGTFTYPVSKVEGEWSYTDVTLNAGASSISFIVLTEFSDSGKLTGDVVFNSVATHKVIYVDTKGKIFYDKKFTIKEDSGGGGGQEDEEIPEKAPDTADSTIKTDGNILRIYYEDTSAVFLHMWGDVAQPSAWGSISHKFMGIEGDFVWQDVDLAAEAKSVSFIPMTTPNDAGKLTGDIVFSEVATHKVIYVDEEGNIFYDKENMKGIKSALVTTAAGDKIELITVKLTKEDIKKEAFSVKDKDGASLTVSKAEHINNSKATLTITGGGLTKTPYTVTYNGKDTSAPLDAGVLDTAYTMTDEDIASLTLNADASANMSFNCYSPLAVSVKLLLFRDAAAVKAGTVAEADIKEMTYNGVKGIWSVSNIDASGYKYYKFRVKTLEYGENDIANIWSLSCAPNSTASEIISLDNDLTKPSDWEAAYTNPFGSSGAETKKYSDAVIYEMHVWDYGAAVSGGKGGKFTDIASDTVINHLKDLGVTHVQILPMFDYAQTNEEANYNWGYNPYHYNVPEGRYVDNMAEGHDAVKQMRQMITALHKAGISVIMDVVYNHTNGTGKGSLYDLTIPKYFYRMTASGNYSNGSGCGNEVATDHEVVRKYVIASLKHWMQDYHINGFRFDLMGLHEKDTMKDIYDALYTIDKNVLVYGEPWTGGTSTVKDSATTATMGTAGLGQGAFDDGLRDAVKGGVFDRAEKGHVQGTYKDDGIIKGLTTGGEHNKTDNLGLTIHYVECHDNNTLFDKLVISNLGLAAEHAKPVGDLFKKLQEATLPAEVSAAGFSTYLDYIKAQDKLSAAYVFLAQGTPFINGGQEFLRTKQGNDNSYGGENGVTVADYEKENKIDFSFKTTYSDVYNTYKGLIALRKSSGGAFGEDATAKASKMEAGVTKYEAGNYLVYFNATLTDEAIDTAGYTKQVKIDTGAVVEEATLPSKVGKKSFVILKK